MSTATNSSSQENDTPIMLFDGKSVSNPGVAAAAAVLLMKNGRRYTVSQFLSSATVEEAEYTGLMIGLRKAKQLGIKELDIKSDSELIVNQINGSSLVSEEKLQTLYQKVQKLLKNFAKISLECVSQEQNRPAINAVNRCIGEALGRESKSSHPSATPLNPMVARFLQLAEQAKEEDYRKLSKIIDEYAFKELTDLRLLVPESIKDIIALKWDGNENNLADIYRWYLRGLPPLIAVQKVKFDNPPVELGEKLPWEGELITAAKTSALPASENAFIDLPTPLESASSSPRPYTEKDTLLEIPFQEQIEESFSETEEDLSKDTLPIEAKVKHVLEIMNNLADDERTELAEQLIQFPEWVHLIFDAIATQLSSPKD